jgi:hypothetical protein
LCLLIIIAKDLAGRINPVIVDDVVILKNINTALQKL